MDVGIFSMSFYDWEIRASANGSDIAFLKESLKSETPPHVEIVDVSEVQADGCLVQARPVRGCKNRPAPFPGRMSTRRLNQALPVLSLSLGFF